MPLFHHPDVVDHADAAVKNLKDLIDLHFRVLTAVRVSMAGPQGFGPRLLS